MHRAARALTSGNETIYNIAAETGFQDPFYFSRIFKKYYRLSPLQYRKEFSADISGHNIAN
ncbi:MAG: helix-turn-helix domain-containing protein [Lentisphaeria bacterium]|nr:helix-turn-helix domain-containing protein [Lentisphaeria bacterium]